jgi:hypothetical protein
MLSTVPVMYSTGQSRIASQELKKRGPQTSPQYSRETVIDLFAGLLKLFGERKKALLNKFHHVCI